MKFLEFPRGQRNGIIVLAVFIVILAIAPFFFSFFQKNYQAQFDIFEKEIDNISISDTQKKIKNKKSYFKFNPNSISKDSLSLLGLSDRQINNWVNFRKKNGRFYQKKDIKKLYTIDSITYNRLEKYIDIRLAKKKKNKFAKKAYRKKSKINLNKATEKELGKCYGIGIKLSQRIIKYRKLLGGFVCMEQLKEVYGIRDNWYVKISSQLSIDKSNIRKININTIKASVLAYHPYITKESAKKIIKERVKNGKYFDIKDLQKRNNLSNKWIKKIKEYLTF